MSSRGFGFIATYEAQFSINRPFCQDLFACADVHESMQHAFGIRACGGIMCAFKAGALSEPGLVSVG